MGFKWFWRKKEKETQEQETARSNSYYFYIAKKLVNELLSQTQYKGQYDNYTFSQEAKNKSENTGKMTGKMAPVSASVTESYGRENVLHYDRKNLENHVKKLEYLLCAPEYSNQFDFVLTAESSGVPSFFRYSGAFQIDEPISRTTKKTIIRIISEMEGSNIKIAADCSIVNFSEFIESAEGNIQNIVHSGNKAFFKKEIKIQVEGLFRRIDVLQKDRTIHAHAVYLKLLDDEIML